jgi:hypothetical protein
VTASSPANRKAQIPIRSFVPARATVDPAPGDEDLLYIARDLALDCVCQAGVTWLSSLYEAIASP